MFHGQQMRFEPQTLPLFSFIVFAQLMHIHHKENMR